MMHYMSGFQLTASLASSLAWPVILTLLAVFVWVKRSDLITLFDSRKRYSERPLKRFKAGPVEFEWEQLIDVTHKQVDAKKPSSIFSNFVSKDLDDIANTVPAAAVLEGFARVEQRLRQIVEDSGIRKFQGRRSSPIGWMARVAFEENLISEEAYGAISNLSRLRNEAAHRVGGAEISASQAHEYLHLIDRVLEALDAKS